MPQSFDRQNLVMARVLVNMERELSSKVNLDRDCPHSNHQPCNSECINYSKIEKKHTF